MQEVNLIITAESDGIFVEDHYIASLSEYGSLKVSAEVYSVMIQSKCVDDFI